MPPNHHHHHRSLSLESAHSTSPRSPSPPSQTFHSSILPHSIPTPALLESVAGAAHYSGIKVDPEALKHRRGELEGTYCCRPTVEIFERSWNKNAVFEDPLSYCKGYNEYAAPGTLSKLLSTSVTDTFTVVCSAEIVFKVGDAVYENHVVDELPEPFESPASDPSRSRRSRHHPLSFFPFYPPWQLEFSQPEIQRPSRKGKERDLMHRDSPKDPQPTDLDEKLIAFPLVGPGTSLSGPPPPPPPPARQDRSPRPAPPPPARPSPSPRSIISPLSSPSRARHRKPIQMTFLVALNITFVSICPTGSSSQAIPQTL
ncbi:hypothetical protein DFS33DRAFT_1388906 [Desarmillaria ectypa]|nr:hypothetical protein DFS33DRAFT_1388906 [Desarmillaria ectypa]